MKRVTDRPTLLLAAGIIALAVAGLRNQPFFWDTVVLSSRQGAYYFSLLGGNFSNWTNLFPPDETDPGHPTLWAMYLAVCWKIAGKSLSVSHFATLPFLWLIAVQAVWLTRYTTGSDRHGWKSLLLLFALPPLTGHLSLVTPDVMLLALWLTAARTILLQNRWQTVILLLLLSLVSLRAVPLMAGLWLWVLLQEKREALRRWWWVAIAGSTGLALWLAGHWLAKGWLLAHAASPWAEHRGLAAPAAILRNAAATGFWLLQYGVVFVTVPALILVLSPLRQSWRTKNLQIPPLASLWLSTGLALAAFTLPFSNPINPRYWLPVMLMGSLWLVSAAIARAWAGWKIALLAPLLATGHLWLLPPPRANAWDSTLAHLWVQPARAELMQGLAKTGHEPATIGTEFPLLASPIHSHFVSGPVFHPWSAHDSLVLYSNLCNGFSDSLQQAFQTHWQPVLTVSSGPIKMQVIKRK